MRFLAHAVTLLVVVGGLARSATGAVGTHLRLNTDHGPVHVWKPAHYDRDTAGIVIYVHGYFTDVDRAWREHHLERQFDASGVNALFIACEAPSAPGDDVSWTSVASLLVAVAEQLDEPLPAGRLIAMGHSGAHRTLLSWLDEDVVDSLILVDALYGDVPEFAAWLTADADRRLIDAAFDTRRWSDELHATVPDTLTFARFPPAAAGSLRGARHARVVYVRSQHDHMELVTGGIAMPMLLRALQLPMVAGASREEPLHGF